MNTTLQLNSTPIAQIQPTLRTGRFHLPDVTSLLLTIARFFLYRDGIAAIRDAQIQKLHIPFRPF